MLAAYFGVKREARPIPAPAANQPVQHADKFAALMQSMPEREEKPIISYEEYLENGR